MIFSSYLSSSFPSRFLLFFTSNMTAMTTESYYVSKIRNDFLSLTNKIEFSRKFIENIMNNKLRHYLFTNAQMDQDEYAEVQFLITRVDDDTMLTMQTEKMAIDDYFLDGLVDKSDYDFDDVRDAYIEKRNEYVDTHAKAYKMWQSSLHTERRVITTQKMTEPCSICTKKHSKECALLLSCNHAFGSKCFYKWADTCIERKTVVTCPMCRETNV